MAKKNLTTRRLLVFGAIFFLVPVFALMVIRLAQGYRPDINSLSLRPSGLLVATSNPDGAQLFIDGKLVSATNTTLNLPPGEYEVEIKKDGYSAWRKTMPIRKELVMNTQAHLFPTFPNLRPLTFTGAANPVISPDGQKVIFNVNDASAEKNGLWVLDLADRPLGFNREPRQIAQGNLLKRDFTEADYSWSPDSKQILVTFQTTINPEARTPVVRKENFLFQSDSLNPVSQFTDISDQLALIFARWQEEDSLRRQAQVSKLPKQLIEVMDRAVGSFVFSPDENKLLYEATASATIPEEIIPPLPATNPSPETRQIEAGKIYVYDFEEDKNFFIINSDELPVKPEAEAAEPPDKKAAEPDDSDSTQPTFSGLRFPQTLTWFPTSRHLFLVRENKISVLEYDNTNWVDIYSGPFVNSFAFPFPTDNKALLLTSLGSDTPANLYALSLK